MKKIFIILIFIFFTKIVKCSLCGSEDWIEFKDEKCFKYVNRVVGHDEAEWICKDQAKGGPTLNFLPTLVSIKSQKEQKELERYLFETIGITNNVWIGAKRKMGNETMFEWYDGSELEYYNWAENYPTNNTNRKCVEIEAEDISKNFTNLMKSNNKGKWKDASCEKYNLVLCEKLQTWSFPQLQKTLLNTINKLYDTRSELNATRHELVNTKSQLKDTINELNDTRNQLEPMFNQRLEGVEGAFTRSFEVGGSINYYYPVAFDLPYDNSRFRQATPLVYDIYRYYKEKVSDSLHSAGWPWPYLAFTLKLMSYGGMWETGIDKPKVLLHFWRFNKGAAKVQLFQNQERRLFVWLRGGGILYHIRSPIDLTRGANIYYENDAIAAPPIPDIGSPAVTVSPIAVGNEDPNLVKTGVYDGWGF